MVDPVRSKEFIVQDTWARMGGLSSTYYGIAEGSFNDYLSEIENPVQKPPDGEDPTDHYAWEHRIEVSGIKSIVFFGMCLEAAIFDSAAVQLGDPYVTQYLDKLDLVSKWVVVPQLICGSPLKNNGVAINALRTLVRARNALVHQKSLPFKEDSFTDLNKRTEKFHDGVQTSFKAVVLLSLEVVSLLGVGGMLPPFDERNLQIKEHPPLIKAAIERCLQIHAKQTHVETSTCVSNSSNA